MSRALPLRVEHAPRRRGTFGLDERRRPDPLRVETEIRAFLTLRLPEVWALSSPPEPKPDGRTLVLLLSRGHAAVLRIVPEPDARGEETLALVARCRSRAIPAAIVSSLDEARAALRRFGVEPRPSPSPLPFPRMFARCRAKPSS